MKKLTVLLLLFPCIAAADADIWLERNDPNEVYAFISIEPDCPIKEQQGEEIISRALTQSRLKRLSNWAEDDLSLFFEVRCVRESKSSWIFSVEGRHTKINTFAPDNILLMTTPLLASEHGIGIGSKNDLRDGLREIAEDVINRYLKANFDL